MKTYSWLINPTSGDYVIVNGNPVRDHSLQFAAYARLKIQKKQWMYAPDADYGSEIARVKKRDSNAWVLLEQLAEQALQPIIDDGRAETVVVEFAGSARHEEDLTISILDAEGQNQLFTLNPVGL